MIKKKKKVRYGVLGLGHIAQVAVLPAFQYAKLNSVLNALISETPNKLKKLGKKYKVSHLYSYDDYENCLTSGNIDAIYIATPNCNHREVVEKAAKHGIPILCEKPMSLDSDSCKAMIRAARIHKTKLMIAYRLHFQAANLHALAMARSKKLGELKIFNSVFTMQIRDPKNIRLSKNMGGGTLYDIGIYCINAARNFFHDEPTEVMAFAASTGEARFSEVDEMTTAILRFPGNRLASFTTSFGATDVSTFDLVGSKARIHLESAYDYAMPMPFQVYREGKVVNSKTFKKSDQFAPELVYFSDCILNNRDPEPSGQEGLADVRIIEALQQSIQKHKPVSLSFSSAIEKDKRISQSQKIKRPPLVRPPEPIQATAPSGE